MQGQERELYELAPPAMVGEMALLTESERTATVRAVRDCEVLRLRAASFSRLVEQHPSVLSKVARLLAERLVHARSLAPRTSAHTIALVPAGCPVGSVGAIAETLTAELQRRNRTIWIGSEKVDIALGQGTSQLAPGDQGWSELAQWLHAVEDDHYQVVFAADSELSEWTRTCLRQADLVLSVGFSTNDCRLNIIEEFAGSSGAVTARRELVLTHPRHLRPEGTASWLRNRTLADHHHLRADSSHDLARLARMVRGKGCGLVLGGGGPRGFAHLGVVRALKESDIPLDVVGGTSIGAVMGALLAQDDSLDEIVRRASEALLGRGRLLDFTLPLVSIASGRKINEMLESEFGSLRIEDLPRRFFCVSADLNKAEEVVHDQGLIWSAVRASLSIPGVFPPVAQGERLLVDGAVLNNLPVDVMRSRIPSGFVTAVDLFAPVERFTLPPFDPRASGWRLLKQRLLRGRSASDLGLVDIMSRASSLSSMRAREALIAQESIDLHVHPSLPTVGAFDFQEAARTFIEMGYRTTVSALAVHKASGRGMPECDDTRPNVRQLDMTSAASARDDRYVQGN